MLKVFFDFRLLYCDMVKTLRGVSSIYSSLIMEMLSWCVHKLACLWYKEGTQHAAKGEE